MAWGSPFFGVQNTIDTASASTLSTVELNKSTVELNKTSKQDNTISLPFFSSCDVFFCNDPVGTALV